MLVNCHLIDLCWEVVHYLFVAELSSWATKSWFLTPLVTLSSWQCNQFLLLRFWTEELLLIFSYPNLTKQKLLLYLWQTVPFHCFVFIIKNLANVSYVVQNHLGRDAFNEQQHLEQPGHVFSLYSLQVHCFDNLSWHHGPRGGQTKTHRRKNPWVLFLKHVKSPTNKQWRTSCVCALLS